MRPSWLIVGLLLGLVLYVTGCPSAEYEDDPNPEVEDIPEDVPPDLDSSDGVPDMAEDPVDEVPVDAPTEPEQDQVQVDMIPDTTSDPDITSDSDPEPDPLTDTQVDPDLPQDPDVSTDPDVDTGPTDIGADVSDAVDTPSDLADATEIPDDLPSGGTVFFSEICDHAARMDARFIEIYNATGSPVDLTDWKVEFHDFEFGTQEYPFPSEVLANGETYVVAHSRTGFIAMFPDLEADDYNEIIDGSGNDTYVLLNGTTIVDIYGEVGVDGTLKPWDYRDSVAKRNLDIINGSAVWNESEWTITAGADEANPGQRN